jgi:hypothetical protein
MLLNCGVHRIEPIPAQTPMRGWLNIYADDLERPEVDRYLEFSIQRVRVGWKMVAAGGEHARLLGYF